jgi:KDO2-lipid IV(A) lauroyltransferase
MDRTTPPIRWLWANSERCGRAWTYWVVHPIVGFYNTAVHHAMRLLPIDACSNFGVFFSSYSPFFFRESDTRARKAWARLRPAESAPATVDAAMRRLWRCVGRTMAEYSVIDRLWTAGRISVVGLENMQAARDANRPLLVAALHLGNWEAVLIAGIESNFAGSGIYLPLDNRFDMRLAIKARDRYKGGQVAAGPAALRTALRVLREKRGPFVIYVDEFIRGKVQAPSFGRPTRDQGNIAYAARLAAMTDAYVVPAYCERLNDSTRFTIHFLPPIEMLRTGNKNSDVIENIKRINAAIEPAILRHLDQWYFLLDIEFDD